MRKANGVICAGAVFFSFITGCTLTDWSLTGTVQTNNPVFGEVVGVAVAVDAVVAAVQNVNAERDRLVAASMDSISASMQQALYKAGFAPTYMLSADGTVGNIVCKARSGQQVTITLHKEFQGNVEHTRIHVEWQDGRGNAVGVGATQQYQGMR